MYGHEPRACDADTLIALCRDAEKYEFNRQAITELLVNEIDPEGINILDCTLPYHRASMGPSREPIWPDHHRCQVLAKIKDKNEPAVFFLDVLADKYEALMTTKELERLMNDPIESGIADALSAAAKEESE